MDPVEIIVLVGSAVVAAVLGAILQRRFTAAHPVVFVGSCELSSVLMTSVDHITLPKEIIEKVGQCHWTLSSEIDQAHGENFEIPLGIAQAELSLFTALLPSVKSCDKCRIKTFELDPGVRGGELPVDS